MHRSPFLSVALASGAAAITTLVAPHAYANGRFPTAQQLAPSPTDPTFIPLMATFGIVISTDTGATWDWVCETAVGYQSSENPTLGVTANNNVLIATFEGLGVTTDRGCTWTMGVGGITKPTVDLAVEATDPHSAFILTSSYLGLDDAGPSYDDRVWVTHDDGATVSQVGASLDPDIIPETIDVAPSDATRIYVSGTRRVAGVASGTLLRSTNGGETFTEADFPLVSGDGGLLDRAPYIAAVDPTNPDRVYIRVDNVDGTRILVSDDGLATTRQIWQAQGQILGFAVSSDGTKVYAGGPSDGLYVVSSTTLAFTEPVWPGQVECLALKGDALLACSNEASGFTVGSSSDDGQTWTPLLHLSCVAGPLACAAASLVTTQCDPLWTAQQEQLGGPCVEDAGAEGGAPAGDGGTVPEPDAGGSPVAQKTGGCSCSTPALASGGGRFLECGIALGALGILTRWRGRRSRHGG